MPALDLNINNFKTAYFEKTGELLDIQSLQKLELVNRLQDTLYSTNGLVLFSDSEFRNKYFHYAKIECARFKGTQSGEFIDQKSITGNISEQSEEAYNFVLRHINKGASIEGVYTVSRWEYPVIAIRETIRNAVVHRDYSLTGKDIKVAIYDDMIEITSPGLLPPSIDYSAMESRQSEVRNKVIAPVFKRMGIIDQWGNGLKLISEELKKYPEIGFNWKEVGLSFQVQFIKLNFQQQELGQELGQELERELKEKTLFSLILQKLENGNLSRKEIAMSFGQNKISGYMNRMLPRLVILQLIENTIPDNLNHPSQKFKLTEKGKKFLQLIKG